MAIIPKDKSIIESDNKIIFNNLEEILKKLNKRFNLRFYTAIYSLKGDYQYCLRTRKTLIKDHGLNQEELQDISNIFEELNLGQDYKAEFNSDNRSFLDNAKNYLDKRENNKKAKLQQQIDDMTITSEMTGHSSDEIAIAKSNSYEDHKILYSNSFGLDVGARKYKLIYIIEIRNMDNETVNTFYHNPQYSFLRMVLDNFFYDFYEQGSTGYIKSVDSKEINTRYNENSVTFLRRMARVFLGKIQSMLKDGNFPAFKKAAQSYDQTDKSDGWSYNNEIDNLFYTFNLFEDIEDISNRTYEGSNPFGSILFLGKSFNDTNNKKIKYALKFKEENRIKLGDSKRIRKLMEITNGEKELYLIANFHEIIGLGEVGWNDLEEHDSLIRLDFKGLSKYDLVCVHTKVVEYTSGKLITEDNKKLYKCGKNLEIVENMLVTVIFKNPKVKEEEYSTEKFKRVFEAEFYQREIDEKSEEYKSLEKIEKIVRKAKEQKHGTMVVITEPETAERELTALGAQSTLIEPREIEAEYMKYLTSIDGAVYFDTKARCHAIGVILDGIANEKVGDPSRGARYNSAHKYLGKLRSFESEAKCIIVIISEDGMVDIIPDLENEEKIQKIVQEIIYLINEENSDSERNLVECEEELKIYENVIEYYLYLEIAKEFYDKKKYDKACEYYELGFKHADQNSVIISKHYNIAGISYYNMKTEEGYKNSINCFNEAIQRSNNMEVKKTYYSNLGSSYFMAGDLARNQERAEQKEYFMNTLDAYKEHIKIAIENELQIESRAYNESGIAYAYLGDAEKDRDIKNNYFKSAIDNYTNAINSEEKAVYYGNRGTRYEDIHLYKEAVEDFITGIIIDNNAKYANNIEKILKKKGDLAKAAQEFYKAQCKERKSAGVPSIEKIFEKFIIDKDDMGQVDGNQAT